MEGLCDIAAESKSPAETYIDDEPTVEDGLGRAQHVNALAHLARTCTTPIVIGIYGGWGVGKTSLMKQINKRINEANTDADRILTVEFTAWQHQYDTNPVAALLQTMLVNFHRDKDETLKDYLRTALRALIPEFKLNAWLPITVKLNNIKDIYDQVLDEHFHTRSDRIGLKEAISALVNDISKGANRIVCFIDDLDRCAPDVAVGMLDALKLYLNIKGCVFVLGLDHARIQRAIQNRHQDAQYLEKIIQVYWSILPIDQTYALDFANQLVSKGRRDETQECIPVIATTFRDNPRAMKRFVNELLIYRHIAESQPHLFGKEYDERITCALLLLREKNGPVFSTLSVSPKPFAIFEDLMRKEELYVEKHMQAGINIGLLSFIQKLRVNEKYFGDYIILSGGKPPHKSAPVLREQEVQPGNFGRHWQDNRGHEFRQTVTIPYALHVGKYPVTVAEYTEFVNESNRAKPAGLQDQDLNHPIVMVSWDDAQAYVQWLNEKTKKEYRLLTEAEWEYCCRAGSDTAYSCGDTIDESKANFSTKGTSKVGLYEPNKFGLYDMHGNVWEWVEDNWHSSYSDDAPTDGSAWQGGSNDFHVIRGGSWSNTARELKSSHRGSAPTERRTADIGFRICWSGETKEDAKS